MSKELQLEVVTPEGPVVSDTADIVVGTGSLGEFGILPMHVPFLTNLLPGELRYRKGGETIRLAVMGGFCQVADDRVTILADSAEKAHEIDIDRAQRSREKAEKRLAAARTEEIDFLRAEAALRRSMVRLKVAEAARGGG